MYRQQSGSEAYRVGKDAIMSQNIFLQNLPVGGRTFEEIMQNTDVYTII